jgi:haloalkane dehalogenase
MAIEHVSSDFPYTSHYVNVLGSNIHYIEEGEGDPILLLHGMPASSYVWRNIIPHLSTLGRCIAPDLIGMGKSDKPDIEYTIFDHIRYMTQFIEVLQLKHITLVLHGWGSLIGLFYAMQHEKNCKGLIFYESYLCSLNGNDISLPFYEQLHMLDENHYDVVEQGARFVNDMMLQSTLRLLTPEELAHYREPFLEKGSGKPLYQYLKEIPRGKEKTKVNELIADYSTWLTTSTLPKLLLYAVPGFITTITMIMWAKEHLPSLEVADIGEALHYAQETNPSVMGETMSVWLQGIEQQEEKQEKK